MTAKMELTPQLAEEICDWIAEGGTLREYCRQEGKPSFKTVYRWIAADEGFAKAMEAARTTGFDAIADEALKIADTPQVGVIETIGGKEGDLIRREDMLGHRKLQVETRLKLLAKWHPKKYGERTTLAGDPNAPLNAPVITVVPYADEKDDGGQG